MTIDTSIRGTAGIVAVGGRMDADQAEAFENACEKLAKDGARHIVADLTELKYVSSMGLRAFLVIGENRQKAGGALVLVGMAGFVKQVFDMTRITPLMRTAETVETALLELR